MINKKMELPVWKNKYDKMGVRPQELYMRQNSLCWLKQAIFPGGEIEIYCTDGKDEAKTDCMLNPTIECVRCMIGFAKWTILNEINKNK